MLWIALSLTITPSTSMTMIDHDLALEAARLYDPEIDANVREVYELLQDHQLITVTTELTHLLTHV